MKKTFSWLAAIGMMAVVFFACSENTNQSAENGDQTVPDNGQSYTEAEQAAVNLASEATLIGQQTLIANLVQAMEDSGVAKAVVFCNVKVGEIYDSLNQTYGVQLARVSHKNRNPANAANERELGLIEKYSGSKDSELTLFDDGDHYTVYRPIRMAIMACSKCHGTPGEDIEQSTLMTLSLLYPHDKATGFKYKDLRGLWKVSVPKAAL